MFDLCEWKRSWDRVNDSWLSVFEVECMNYEFEIDTDYLAGIHFNSFVYCPYCGQMIDWQDK